mgnify:CR=1 FL=1
MKSKAIMQPDPTEVYHTDPFESTVPGGMQLKRHLQEARNENGQGQQNLASHLAASVAHEILNPLTALKGYVRLLARQGANPGYLEVMESELARIEFLARELMTLSKPRAVRKERHNAMRLVREAAALFKVQAQQQGIAISVRGPKQDIWLDCEEHRIKQVLVNVIKNAMEAMPDGGRIVLNVRPCLHEVRIVVRDEGYGFSQEQLERACEPYFTTKPKGTGLGLMISRCIMEQHDGRLEIRSEPGKGTRVYLFFPKSGS